MSLKGQVNWPGHAQLKAAAAAGHSPTFSAQEHGCAAQKVTAEHVRRSLSSARPRCTPQQQLFLQVFVCLVGMVWLTPSHLGCFLQPLREATYSHSAGQHDKPLMLVWIPVQLGWGSPPQARRGGWGGRSASVLHAPGTSCLFWACPLPRGLFSGFPLTWCLAWLPLGCMLQERGGRTQGESHSL